MARLQRKAEKIIERAFAAEMLEMVKELLDENTELSKGEKVIHRQQIIEMLDKKCDELEGKIKSLEHNMGSFWHKVQNPALLLAGGTESQSRHTTPRRSGNRFRSSAAPRRLMAGSPSIGGKVTGISSRFKQSKIANSKNFGIRDAVSEYLRCLLTDGVCMAGGGWGFNWSPEIRNALSIF